MEQILPEAKPNRIERCQGCGVPTNSCICDTLTPTPSPISVLILRHPQEAKSKLGTAELLSKLIPGTVLKTGLSWRNISHALGREAKPSEWVALFLGSKKIHPAISEQGKALVFVDKKGTPLPNQDELYSKIKGIILLDGNWSQSKTMWWRNAWLTRCQRGILNPNRKSLYKNARREPRKESLSTIEAAAEALGAVTNNSNISENLINSFSTFLKRI